MHATVFDFDETDHSGHVVLDDGRKEGFSAEAFAAGGLRLLRPGQRVRLERDNTGAIDLITVATLP
jgi:cold shock CspA family protein